MIEWPWLQVERDVRSRFVESEVEIKNQIKNAEADLKREVESLSNKLVSIVCDMEGNLKKEREAIIEKIKETDSNIASIHKNAIEQNNVIADLRNRISLIESRDSQSDFFSEKETIVERGKKFIGRIRKFFSNYHILIASNLLFILSAAALTWLVLKNM